MTPIAVVEQENGSISHIYWLMLRVLRSFQLPANVVRRVFVAYQLQLS